MLKISMKCLILLILFYCCYSLRESERCLKSIYRDCNHQKSLTEEEIEIAKDYLQDRFQITDPIRKRCKKLRVRKDIKCLSKAELKNFTEVFKELNRIGVLEKLTRIHVAHWPAAHKFSEGLNWHRWFINEFEKEMIKINPYVSMPYWEYMSEFAAPENSIVFDYFGHSGKKENDFCVMDGLLANLTVNYPEKHCLRRQWNKDGTLPSWEPAEWATAINQMATIPSFVLGILSTILRYTNTTKLTERLSEIVTEFLLLPTFLTNKPFAQFEGLLAFIAHFKTHLSIGGLNGDMSLRWAPQDVLFWLFHDYQADYCLLKWQLSDDSFLVPESYDLGLRLDQDTMKIQ